MSKSVLVIDTPENCYDCPFGTAYCGELEYAVKDMDEKILNGKVTGYLSCRR